MPAETAPRKVSKTSIVTQLSLLFLMLAVVNLVVTWVFSGANQMRLISEKADLSGSTVAFEILRRLPAETFQPGRTKSNKPAPLNMAKIADSLRITRESKDLVVPQFDIVSTEFEYMGGFPGTQKSFVTAEVSQNVLKAIQLRDLSGKPFLGVPDILAYNIRLYIPLTHQGERDLVFVTQVRLDSIPSDLKSLVRLIFATIALMLLIQVGIGFLIYRILIRPIRQVSNAAVELGGGNFATINMPRRQRDEIFSLIESFNQMSTELKQKDVTINNQLNELQEKNDVMDFELEIAERIQQSILPDKDRLDGVHAAVEYVPLHRVSGDVFDFVHLPDGSAVIIIADASGHGVPAAFLTILLKVFFSDLVHRYHQPAELVRHLNTKLSQYLEGTGFYLTAFCIRILPDLRAEYCNCGHPSPLVVRQDGELINLDGENEVLGLSAELDQFNASEIELAESDRLVLFTDGLTELKNENRQFLPEADLHRILRETRHLPCEEARAQVLTFAREFQGSVRASDDLTLMVLPIAGILTGNAVSQHGHAVSAEAEVVALLEKIVQIRNSASFTALLINGHLRLGNHARAQELLAKAEKRYPDSRLIELVGQRLKVAR